MSALMSIVNNLKSELQSSHVIFINDFWSAALASSTTTGGGSKAPRKHQRSATTNLHSTRQHDNSGGGGGGPESALLRLEILKLRDRLSKQDFLLQSTVQRLQSQSRLKEGIEDALVKRLSKTRDVLEQARGNLEVCCCFDLMIVEFSGPSCLNVAASRLGYALSLKVELANCL